MNTKEFKKVVAASIMGDGYFQRADQQNSCVNTCFLLKQISTHRDYIEYMASVLDDLTSVKIIETPAYADSRGYNCKAHLQLKTGRHPTYKEMYNRLYRHVDNTHVKVIDPHYMTLFDLQSLAMLYMDDGWIETKENKTVDNYVRIGLSTHAFTYYENLYLRGFIAEKFGFHFDVARQKQKSGCYKFYLRAKGRENCLQFLDGVEKYIFPSFQYKLNSL